MTTDLQLIDHAANARQALTNLTTEIDHLVTSHDRLDSIREYLTDLLYDTHETDNAPTDIYTLINQLNQMRTQALNLANHGRRSHIAVTVAIQQALGNPIPDNYDPLGPDAPTGSPVTGIQLLAHQRDDAVRTADKLRTKTRHLERLIRDQADFNTAVIAETSRRITNVRDYLTTDIDPTDMRELLNRIDGYDTEATLKAWADRATELERLHTQIVELADRLQSARTRITELEAIQPETVREAHHTLDQLGVPQDGTLSYRIALLATKPYQEGTHPTLKKPDREGTH